VDFITDRLPRRARAGIQAASALLGAALLAAILWHSVGQALIQFRQGDRSQTLGIPMLWYWAPLVAGVALSVLAVLLVAARALRKLP
jgi:TRAP-type C4-dicarboxylate transport system permease small subunit